MGMYASHVWKLITSTREMIGILAMLPCYKTSAFEVVLTSPSKGRLLLGATSRFTSPLIPSPTIPFRPWLRLQSLPPKAVAVGEADYRTHSRDEKREGCLPEPEFRAEVS